MFSYTNLNPSFDNGDPVEQIVLNFDNLYLYFKVGLDLRRASTYFALIPNKVIFSFSAIFNSKSSFLYIGDPSNKTIDAFEAKTLTSQFHIIHPQVVK